MRASEHQALVGEYRREFKESLDRTHYDNVATFALCRDETISRRELRSAGDDATWANVGDHVPPKSGWFLLGDLLRFGRHDSGVFARKALFFGGK